MKYRIAWLLATLTLWAVAVAWWGQLIGPAASDVRVLHQAEFHIEDEKGQASEQQSVNLPHVLKNTALGEGSTAVYRLPLPYAGDGPAVAISMLHSTPGTMVYLGSTLIPGTKLTGRQDEVAIAKLGIPAPGKFIEIRVPHRFSLQTGLDSVGFGPETVIERRALTISYIRWFARYLSSALGITLSLLAFIGFWFHPTLISFLLAYAGFSFSLWHAWVELVGFWQTDDARLAGHLFLSCNLVFAFSLLLLRLMKKKILDLSVIGGLGVLLAGTVFFTQSGDLEFRRTLGFVLMSGCLALILVRAGQQLVMRRQWLLVLIIIGIAIRLSTAIANSWQNSGYFGFTEWQDRQIAFSPIVISLLLIWLSQRFEYLMKRYQLIFGELRHIIRNQKRALRMAAEQQIKVAGERAAHVERKHWIREIHDGLGSELISLQILAENVKNDRDMGDLKNNISNSIEQLRMMVNCVSDQRHTIPSLLGDMRYRLEKRMKSAKIDLKWNVDPSTPLPHVNSVTALNMQRIILEAITNILKHAQAQTVEVSMLTEDDELVVRISDDGKGFHWDQANSGRGITHMKERAQLCGGAVHWTSTGPGTEVQIRMPIDRAASTSGPQTPSAGIRGH
ncbi:MAG: sensor histidine kinase [Hydrogenophaga sp.]